MTGNVRPGRPGTQHSNHCSTRSAGAAAPAVTRAGLSEGDRSALAPLATAPGGPSAPGRGGARSTRRRRSRTVAAVLGTALCLSLAFAPGGSAANAATERAVEGEDAAGGDPVTARLQGAAQALAHGELAQGVSLLVAAATVPPGRGTDGITDARRQKVALRLRAEVHYLHCRAHLERGAYGAALDACQAAIDTRTGVQAWRFHQGLGEAQLALGRLAAAEVGFRNARTLNPRALAPRRGLRALHNFEADSEQSGERLAVHR